MAAATQGADGLSRESMVGVLSFLEGALALLDQHDDRPDLGARVQEIIDALCENGLITPGPPVALTKSTADTRMSPPAPPPNPA